MRILCVGDVNGDLIVPYGKALHWVDGQEPVGVSFRVGGTVGNTARFLGALGDHPYFVGDLCGDDIGRSLQEALVESGVDISYSVEGDNRHILCIAVLDDKGDRLILPWLPPGARLPEFRKESFSKVPIEDYWLYTSGMLMTNDVETMKSVVAFFRMMKEKTASKAVFDLNVRVESYGLDETRCSYFEQMIALSDIVVGNFEREISYFTHSQDPEEGCLEFAKDRVVVAHNGGEDILVVDHGTGYRVPVHKVEVRHTIGAGDVFNAGLLHGLSRGDTVKEAVAEGAKVARDYLIAERNS